MITGAFFNESRTHRYRLWRYWGDPTARPCNFIMLNPSTADEVDNDPTVERCERRARSWGYAGLVVTNIFGVRATDPKDMKAALDPVGILNDREIYGVAGMSDIVICAWGNHGAFQRRSAAVCDLLRGIPLYYLHLTKAGEPAHPLYLPYSLTPVRWK